MPDPIDVTATLSSLAAGDPPAASRLIPVLYEELRSLATTYFQRLPPGQTLEPTALVHEAFVRLVQQPGVPTKDRAHFFALAARAMRGVLVDTFRARTTAKREGGRERMSLSSVEELVGVDAVELLALDDALTRLAARSERQARVVELRFFAGMRVGDVALALGVGKTTVEQDWRIARAWLSSELADAGPGA